MRHEENLDQVMAIQRHCNIFRYLSSLCLMLPLLLTACQASAPPPTSDFIVAPPPTDITTTPRPWTALPPPSVRFEHLSVEDGLAHSEVGAIAQDDLGFMWFATQNGLNRYDGHSSITYRHDPDDEGSLRDSFIESLFVASDGTLWIGTQDGVLEQFERGTGTFTHVDLSSHLYAIAEDLDGALWLGSLDPGLLRFDPVTGEVETIWPAREVTGVAVDAGGGIWAVSPEAGLAHYDPTKDELFNYILDYPAHDLVFDKEGTLWLGTWGGGLGLWDEDEGCAHFSVASLLNESVSTLHLGRDGILWIGTYQDGLIRFDPNKGIIAHFAHNPTNPQSLGPQIILSIFEDRSGVLWVGGGVGAGVYKLAVDADRFGHYHPLIDDPNSLSSALVTSIGGDSKGNVWLGTFTGLDHWDQTTGRWSNYHHDPDDPNSLINDAVRSIYVDSQGKVWVGTEGGLERFNPAINGFEHMGGPVVMWMHEGSSGRFWMATKDGFYEYDRHQDRFNLIDEGYAWKIMVLEDDRGHVWVGSSGDGAILYDPDSGTWETIAPNSDEPSSLSDDFVETIHQDHSGVIWLGTANGLNRYEEERSRFIHYGVTDGLLDDRIAGILEDDQGYLWLATNSGLSRFNPIEETFENYTVRDGLQSNIFWRNSYFKGADGQLFFGGDNGINAFFPENITANPRVPPVAITGVSLFNQPLHVDLTSGQPITFDYDENFLSFDFVTLDYVDPGQNQYAYQMEGLDGDWVQAGNRRHADYPDLRPGDYTFRVLGSNNDGVWNEVGASVAITIQPPFWETPWFIILVLLVLGGAAYGGFRLRVRNLEARGHELEQEVAARTTELQQTNLQLEQAMSDRLRVEEALAEAAAETAVREERDRLARDLHDSVTQSIYSTTLLAEAGQRHAAGGDVEQSQSTFRRLGQITQQALKEMRLLVYELRPPVLKQVGLVAALQGRLDAVERRAGIDARLIVEDMQEFNPECEAALYYLTHEALNNALKHAAPEKVVVRLEAVQPGGCRLIIRDDGAGFDPAEAAGSGGLGLVGMRERVEQIHGTFVLKSTPDSGTIVTIMLPQDPNGEG